MLNNILLFEDKEDVSHDVESLFTNIPIKETIDFICDEIYNRKKLNQSVNNLFLRNCYINVQQNAHLA